MKPIIFISAVSKELAPSRQLVANTLLLLGYEPVWQDVFGTEAGDLKISCQTNQTPGGSNPLSSHPCPHPHHA